MHDLQHHFILLDSQGSDHLFCNEWLIDGVKRNRIGLKTHSNGGSLHYCRQGSFKGLEKVWINENGIANILSLGRLSELGLRITLDTWNGDDAFVVHLDNVQLRFHKLRRHCCHQSLDAVSKLDHCFCWCKLCSCRVEILQLTASLNSNAN